MRVIKTKGWMARGLALLLPAALLLAPVTLAAAAGGEKGDWELGLFGGQGFPDDYERTAPPGAALDPEDDLLYGARVGYFFHPRWSLEGSYQTFSSDTDFTSGSNVEFEIDSIRLNLLLNFRPGADFRPFLTLGAGRESTDVEGLLDEDDIGFNVGGGLRWFLGNTFGIRLDARYVSVDVGGSVDDRQGNLEGTFGILWAFGGQPAADSDGDGVKDRRDKCPDTPRGAVVDAMGCPLDGDKDGVPDGIDKCPDTKPGMAVDASGCPKDSDGDGVNDALDKCPGTPKGAKVDSAGCPVDSDGDGVADGIDKCPDTPKGAQVDATGCPKDSDGDGVPDGLDKCPDTPKGAQVDAAGCPKDSDGDGVPDGTDKCPDTPKGKKVDEKGCEILFDEVRSTLVLKGVNFEFNSADLTPNSRTILDSVAASLREWKEIRVEVAGHTDSIGSDGYNKTLSQRRAESVRKYLVSKGVDGSRLTAKGYGESKPIADNGTDAGRAENRRVELKKLN